MEEPTQPESKHPGGGAEGLEAHPSAGPIPGAERVSRLLIVEDDASQLTTLTSIFEDEGFEVEGCLQPREALERIRTDRYGIIILDLRLPGLSGIEVLERIRALGVQARVIIHTGYGSFESARDSVNLGAFAYVEKLGDPDELIHHVHRAQREQLFHYAGELEAAIAARTSELRESEQRFRALFEQSRDAIFMISSDGLVVVSNRAARELLQRDRAGLVGRSFFHLLSSQREAARLESALRHAEFVEDFEARFTTGTGSEVVCLVTAVARRDDRGRICEFQAVLRDVTERRWLEQKILDMSEHEQERIGQDLHDDLGQHLTGISYLSKVVEQKMRETAPDLVDDVRNIETLVNEAISKTKALARGLYPIDLKSDGLLPALEELARTTEDLFEVRCRVVCPRPFEFRDPVREPHIYRIVQEAVNNAVRHSGTTAVEIELDHGGAALRVSVRDSGNHGLADDRAGRGMGLRIMHYRANAIGARLEIEPRRGGGTEVTCTLPQR